MINFKKLFLIIVFLFLMALMCLYAKNERVIKMYKGEKIGEVTLNKEIMFKDQRGVGKTYYVTAPKSAKYFISVITIGCFGNDYNVILDNQNVVEGKVILGDGWKSGFVVDKANSKNSKAIQLSKGNHTISFIGEGSHVPDIISIRISTKEKDAKLSADNLIAMTQEAASKSLLVDYFIQKEKEVLNSDKQSTLSAVYPSPVPNYKYNGYTDVYYSYTYKWFEWYDAGASVTFETRNCTDDPVMYIFYIDDPDPTTNPPQSWANDDISLYDRNSRISFIAPKSGYYCGILRSYCSKNRGICDLYYNNTLYKSSAPFEGRILYCYDSNRKPGEVLNFFTAKPGVNPVGNDEYDTMIFTMSGQTAPVTGYSDDYFYYDPDYKGNNAFEWGRLSRIKKSYKNSDLIPRYVLITNYFPQSYSRYIDVYANCNILEKAYWSHSFPNLKIDDAIMSSDPGIPRYNCFAWSGGITSTSVDPGAFNNLTGFDNYYANKIGGIEGNIRYSGAENFVRCGNAASDPEEVIALWGTINSPGNIFFTHASVKKSYAPLMHGYDWESKDGRDGYRFFHPRNALVGTAGSSGYGDILYVYKSTGTFAYTSKMAALGIKGPLTFDESVKLGLTEVEEVSFTPEELKKIANSINQIPLYIKKEFTDKFKKTNQIKINTPQKFMSNIKDNNKPEEYNDLIFFCQINYKIIWPLLFDLLQKKDSFVIDILKDTIYKQRIYLMDEITRENELNKYTEDGTFIFHSSEGDWKKFCKKVLEEDF